MKALFIANLDLAETEGIYKKVCAEAEAVGQAVGNCVLITRKGRYAVTKEQEDVAYVTEIPFFEYVHEKISKNEIGLVYIRHMIPNFKLIRILKFAHKKGIQLYYEIPTYPYFAEQFRTSRKKYRAVAKIGLDILFWPLIYRYVDRVVVIRSNTTARLFNKMVEITNGVHSDNIKGKTYDMESQDNTFRMVAVGTLYPYHGYDRILQGLAKCQEEINGTQIEFHVIGSSNTIDELQELSKQLGLKHVIFHGTKTTEELNTMYDAFDVGLGCLALHRRNADIDTTLKIIEYYCRGVPVVTSGVSPMDVLNMNFTIHVPDNENPIEIEDIYKKHEEISLDEKKRIHQVATENFAWKTIMLNLLKEERDCSENR